MLQWGWPFVRFLVKLYWEAVSLKWSKETLQVQRCLGPKKGWVIMRAAGRRKMKLITVETGEQY